MSLRKKLVVTDDDLPYTFDPPVRKRKIRGTCGQNQLSQPKSANKKHKLDEPQPSTSRASPSLVNDDFPHDNHHPENEEMGEEVIPPTEESNDELYAVCILQQRLITALNSDMTAFAIPGFKNGQITDEVFILRRKQITDSSDTTIWLDCCSCNPYRCRLWRRVPNCVTTLKDLDFSGEHSECPHIVVFGSIKRALSLEAAQSAIHPELDHQGYGKQKTECSNFEWDPTTICLTIHDNYGTHYHVVKVKYTPTPTFTCQKYACKAESTVCQHVNLVKAHILEDADFAASMKKPLTARSRLEDCYIPSSLSHDAIKFHPPIPALSLSVKKVCPPIPDQCSCGQKSSTILEQGIVSYWTLQGCSSLKVSCWQCAACENTILYDGKEDGVLNMGSYLIAHEVFHAYMRQLFMQGTTMASFYKEWAWMQMGNTTFSDEMSYYKFQHGWYSFCRLLDVPNDPSFDCPVCGPYPDVVVMDGVTVAPRKVFIPWKAKKIEPQKLDGSCASRVFMKSMAGRNLLIRFTKPNFTSEEFHDLLKIVREYQAALLPLLQSLQCHTSDKQTCPQPLQRFIACLGSSFPVCSYFPPGMTEIVSDLHAHSSCPLSVTKLALLEELCPVLASVMEVWDETILPIVTELVQLSEGPFKGQKENNLPVCCDDCNCGKKDISFFPTLPQRCHRGSYVLDSQSKQICLKKSKGHPTLAPGLFTISCHHGVFKGYQIMDQHESPNVPFTILRTRFPKAPSVVIYDNACNLQIYCFNRDPLFFKDTKFLVDRLHWKNHTACPESFNISLYPQYRTINSQVAEQRNALLVKMKPMLSYMNLDNFLMHMNIYMWFHNMMCHARNQFENDKAHSKFFSSLYHSIRRLK